MNPAIDWLESDETLDERRASANNAAPISGGYSIGGSIVGLDVSLLCDDGPHTDIADAWIRSARPKE